MAAEEEEEKPVPDSGAIFTFGKSKFEEKKFWLKNDKPAQISCGDEHSVLITGNGKLYVFGSNINGQLGIGSGNVISKPKCVKALKSEKVKFTASGRNHTLLCTVQGKVYSSGWNSEGQLGHGDTTERTSFHEIVFFSSQTKIKQLSAGSNTSAALTVDGKLFMWGENSEGQLGLSNEKCIYSPCQVDIGKPISWVSCGYYHSAFITQDGELYTFGEPDNGKLGLLLKNWKNTDNLSESLNNGESENGFLWRRHTIAVTDKEVYTFGLGQFGQLGHGTSIFEMPAPKVIDALKPHRIRYVACGESHTAVITDKGLLYTFGDGRYGKLGLGEENFTNQFLPTLCRNFLKFNVQSVACGGCHMLVFAIPRTNESEAVIDDLKENLLTINEDLERSITLQRSPSARMRRREKKYSPDQIRSLTRTLPPLSGNLLESSLPVPSNTIPPSLLKIRQESTESSANELPTVSKSDGKSQKDLVKSFSTDDETDGASQKSFGGTTDILNMTHVVRTKQGNSTFSPVQKRKELATHDQSDEAEDDEDEESVDEEAVDEEDDDEDGDEEEDEDDNKGDTAKENKDTLSNRSKPGSPVKTTEEEQRGQCDILNSYHLYMKGGKKRRPVLLNSGTQTMAEFQAERPVSPVSGPDNAAIMAAITNCQSVLTAKFDNLQEQLNYFKHDLDKMRDRAQESERRIGETEDGLSTVTVAVESLKRQVKILTDRAEDAENRCRRNNIRIIGIPERAEGDAPESFVENLIKNVLAPEGLSPFFVVERAHRIPFRPPPPGAPPRPFILKLLNFRDRDTILMAARKRRDILFDGAKLSFFPDFTSEVQKQRRSFNEVRARLRAKNIRVRYDPVDLAAFLDTINLPSLSEADSAMLDGPITCAEIEKAIALMSNRKAPGPDGLPSEWYKKNGPVLASRLLEVFSEALHSETIPKTFAQATITLIYKEGKPRDSCASYRPISLLNQDAKILAKVLANRLNTVILSLIGADQSGFMPGRTTGINLRRLFSNLQIRHDNAGSRVVISLDNEKAFDSVEWPYLWAVLAKFGLPPTYIKYIQLLYKNPKARVRVTKNTETIDENDKADQKHADGVKEVHSSGNDTTKTTFLEKTRRLSLFRKRSTTSPKAPQANGSIDDSSKENTGQKTKTKESKDESQNSKQEDPNVIEQLNQTQPDNGANIHDAKSKAVTCTLL
ncbi:LOW QUALITY PROTEIN: X-linked retinitis pigmentosa GTPase regulator [Gastrophryne carolinensis]